MTDIALVFDNAQWAADLQLAGGDLATDEGMRTALIISLFSDRRARADDELPYPGADRRGWWGDVGNDDANDRIGSRLWLLERAKLTPRLAERARDMVREALAWLLEDGIASELVIDVQLRPVTAASPTGALAITVEIIRPDGPGRQRYDFVWDSTLGALA